MRIVIATGIFPPDIGGPASLASHLLRSWRHLGHDVVVVAYGEGSEEHVSKISRKTPLPIRYILFAYRTWILTKDADIMFIQGAVSEGLPATLAGMLRRIPRVMRIPGDYAWEMYRQDPRTTELLDDFVTKRHERKIYLLERIERWTSKHVHALITPSEYLKHIVNIWGVPEKNVHVVLNTVSPFSFVSDEDTRQQYQLDGKKILLCVARAVPWKRFDFLIRVLSKLSAEHVLVLAGDGPMLGPWKKEAERMGISNRVMFLGRIGRDALANWYRASDALVLASSYEGYPFVVAEAVSFGLPCFVSDKAGNPETEVQYPEHVTVLPYNDESVWLEKLSMDMARLPCVQNRSFEQFANELLTVLKTYARIND